MTSWEPQVGHYLTQAAERDGLGLLWSDRNQHKGSSYVLVTPLDGSPHFALTLALPVPFFRRLSVAPQRRLQLALQSCLSGGRRMGLEGLRGRG